MKKLLLLLVVSSFCIADQTASRLILKHREHNGVGYDTGYSTLQAFLAPSWKNGFMPFIDLRGHVFDDQKFATNAGVGLRYDFSKYTFGGNFYIDYRNATHLNPFQLAGGLEFLSDTFDIRANGYGPFTNASYKAPLSFVEFMGNRAQFKQKAKAALPAIEAEIGSPIGQRCQKINLYAALGPYYLFKRTVSGVNLGNAIGGKGRLVTDYRSLINFAVDATYDKIFKWTVQGTAAISIPLGHQQKQGNYKFLCQARNQLPYRDEIIPIDSGSKKRTAPFNIIFVNNTSSSNGTFESPYPTLALAETNSSAGDVIYVFPGDGTTTGMDSGISLKSSQRFHGSGSPMDLDGFIVPTQTIGHMPKIENTAGNAINLSDENTAIGFNIVSASGCGIDNTGVTGGSYTILDNIITNTSNSGINIASNINGQSTILRNNVSMTGGDGISITTNGNVSYTSAIFENNFENTGSEIAINIILNDQSTHDSFAGSNTDLNYLQFYVMQTNDNSSGFAFVTRNKTQFIGSPSNIFDEFRSNDTSFLEYYFAHNILDRYNLYMVANNSSHMKGLAFRNEIFNLANLAVVSPGFHLQPGDSPTMDITLRGGRFHGIADEGSTIILPSGVTQANVTFLMEDVLAYDVDNTNALLETSSINAGYYHVTLRNNICTQSSGTPIGYGTGGTASSRLILQNNICPNTLANSNSIEVKSNGTACICATITGNSAPNNILNFDQNATSVLRVESTTPGSPDGTISANDFGSVTQNTNAIYVGSNECTRSPCP